MAVAFMDSSTVVKRYVQEVGSVWVSGLFTAAPANRIIVAAITRVEVVAALTRRVRSATITQADAAAACALFLADILTDYRGVPITDAVLSRAVQLAQSYKLRGYDAVQLAASTEVNQLRLAAGLPPVIFVSADRDLNAAASAEGLTVDDPNAHP